MQSFILLFVVCLSFGFLQISVVSYSLKDILEIIKRDDDYYFASIFSNYNLDPDSKLPHQSTNNNLAKLSLLHLCAKYNSFKVAEYLLQRGANADLLTENGRMETALMIASKLGNDKIIKVLVDNRIKDSEGLFSRTSKLPFHKKIMFSMICCNRVSGNIKRSGSDPNIQNFQGETALHLAVYNGHSSTAKLLILRGAKLNIKQSFGYTPFHYAVITFHIHCLKVLVQFDTTKTGLSERNSEGDTPISLVYRLFNSDRNENQMYSRILLKQMMHLMGFSLDYRQFTFVRRRMGKLSSLKITSRQEEDQFLHASFSRFLGVSENKNPTNVADNSFIPKLPLSSQEFTCMNSRDNRKNALNPPANEDRIIAQKFLLRKLNSYEEATSSEDQNNEYAFVYGVLDGHGGDQVVTFLLRNIASELEKAISPLFKNVLIEVENFPYEEVKQRIRKVVLTLDKRICQVERLESGSTASFAVIIRSVIFIVNVGDSKTILLKNDKNLIYETVEHKPENKLEAAHIRNAGGSVDAETGRVNKILLMSRAFGDCKLKRTGQTMMYNDEFGQLYDGTGGIIRVEPDIEYFIGDYKNSYQLLSGSDGFFDFYQDTKVLINNLKQIQPRQNICKNLVDSAFQFAFEKRINFIDDVSIIYLDEISIY